MEQNKKINKAIIRNTTEHLITKPCCKTNHKLKAKAFLKKRLKKIPNAVQNKLREYIHKYHCYLIYRKVQCTKLEVVANGALLWTGVMVVLVMMVRTLYYLCSTVFISCLRSQPAIPPATQAHTHDSCTSTESVAN